MVSLFVILYGFFLYKKPHGNLLKIAMLLFAAVNIISDAIVLPLNPENSVLYIIGMLSSGAVCYGAGRLNRIEQNKILFPVIAALFFLRSILLAVNISIADILFKCSLFGYPVMFLTLCCAYFTRYQAHKEAGLADK